MIPIEKALNFNFHELNKRSIKKKQPIQMLGLKNRKLPMSDAISKAVIFI